MESSYVDVEVELYVLTDMPAAVDGVRVMEEGLALLEERFAGRVTVHGKIREKQVEEQGRTQLFAGYETEQYVPVEAEVTMRFRDGYVGKREFERVFSEVVDGADGCLVFVRED